MNPLQNRRILLIKSLPLDETSRNPALELLFRAQRNILLRHIDKYNNTGNSLNTQLINVI